jgi:fatty acid desaturase
MSYLNDVRINWYHSPIDKETLRSLTTRCDWKGFAQIIPQLLLTVATGVGAYYAWQYLSWPLVVLVLYIHATVYSFLGLSGAGHELCHGTPFKTRFWNEFFLKLVAFLSYTNYIHFRASHNGHHKWTVHKGIDLEVVLPITINKRDLFWMLTFNVMALKFILQMTFRHACGIIKGEWEERIFPETDMENRRKMRDWARFILVGHLLLAAAFIYFKLWPLLFIITLAPFYGGWLNFLCGFTQHVGLVPSVPDFRLCCRTVILNPLTRFFYWHMNYHIEHHMYAAVPFYNLRHLRKAIEADLPPAYPGLLAAWREIIPIMRKQKEDPAYVFVPPLPGEKMNVNSMNEKYTDFENKLLLFINSVNSLLPENVISEATDYVVKFGEYECALDLVCYNLDENDIKINKYSLDVLIEIVSDMGMKNEIGNYCIFNVIENNK